MNDLTLSQALIDFAQFLWNQAQIINNPASILVICIAAHLISSRISKLHRKSLQMKIRQLSAQKSTSQPINATKAQSHSDTRPAPKIKETPVQDVAQIEGFSELSATERRIVIAGLRDGSARIGKTRIGIFNINRSGQLVPQV